MQLPKKATGRSVVFRPVDFGIYPMPFIYMYANGAWAFVALQSAGNLCAPGGSFVIFVVKELFYAVF